MKLKFHWLLKQIASVMIPGVQTSRVGAGFPFDRCVNIQRGIKTQFSIFFTNLMMSLSLTLAAMVVIHSFILCSIDMQRATSKSCYMQA